MAFSGTFLDLNSSPQPPSSATSTTTFITPKIEPKAEPYDDGFAYSNLHPPPVPPFLSTSTPPYFTNPLNAPPSESSSTATPPPSSGEDGNTVYSDYNRITEMFRAAFDKGIQGLDDFKIFDPDSRAIVPVPASAPLDTVHPPPPEEDNRLSTFVPPRRRAPKSLELVRVTSLGIEDQRYFRDLVKQTRMLYDSLRIFSVMRDEKERGRGSGRQSRGDLKAASLIRARDLCLNRDKRIVGPIPGVQIGDVFFFRMEMCVVGLHGQPQAGIDYLPASMSTSGEQIATSVIVSGGYEDDEDGGDVLIYTGHGGQDKLNRQCQHQKMEGGNLAMERSLYYGIEVRVIRGIKYENNVSSKVYVYDGLYKIVQFWFDVGKSGFGVFKFKLVRIEGQPEMGSSTMRFSRSLKTKPLSMRPVGYLSLDMSNNKENVPILLYNDFDNSHEPLYFDYLVKTVFPPFVFVQGSNSGTGCGCNCVSGCTDNCLCAMKNGGEFAYDYHGNLVRGKPVIFECGPFCQCPPSCHNRVTQRGLRNRLELFRSPETGWGVRSLDILHAGAFICEYAGVALTREQSQILSMNGDTLVYPGRFSDKWREWGDLSKIFPDYERPTHPSLPPLDFAMDVSRMRNIACYMSHSTSPNVLVQFVLYDHYNLMFPHIMLFAMENIPPLTELSLDYGVADEWTGKLSICHE